MLPKIGYPLFIALITFSACNAPEHEGEMLAILHNYTGLDGCGWVLEIDNGKILEPTNLSTFPIQLEEGKSLYITYTLVEGGSICMVGDLVEIQTLTE